MTAASIIRIVDDDPNIIAERLEIAVRTVEFHRAGSMRKLGCHSAAELKAKLSLVPEAREAFE